MKRRQVGIGDGLEPVPHRLVLAKGGLELLAVPQLDRAPAAAFEYLVEALEHPVGACRIEALAIVIDDPPEVADVVLGALDNGFIDIAFIELCIADQRDETAAFFL